MKKIIKYLSALYTFYVDNQATISALASAAQTLFASDKPTPRAIADASAVRADVRRLDLCRPSFFDALDDAKLAGIWNGYGADAWPEWLRVAVTWVFRNFQPVAMVHDVQFAFSDGTHIGWLLTLDYWKKNATIALDDRYPLRKPWLLPARCAAWVKLRASLRALKIGSWQVWVSAEQRNTASS